MSRTIALAGNPNVGKSTIFNALTGLNQHTGNWPGKTVSAAWGEFSGEGQTYTLVDLPGTYSLMAHSPEEEAARNFLCFDAPDAAVVVCDATCLERGMNLVLQVMELCPRVLVCVNLMDEAGRKGISLNLPLLSRRLGVEVVGVSAHSFRSLSPLISALGRVCTRESTRTYSVSDYPGWIADSAAMVESVLNNRFGDRINCRWMAVHLLEDSALLSALCGHLGDEVENALTEAVAEAKEMLPEAGMNEDCLRDMLAGTLVKRGEEICAGVEKRKGDGRSFDRRLDRWLTGRLSAYPVMLLLLAGIFWLTVKGANYPSALLAEGLYWVEQILRAVFSALNAPSWLMGALIDGVWRVSSWVVSVMLPPMAIFFPLFTLLEDAGYLPRVAYNLDRPFQWCRACGKQALCMGMGLGCNAAGVVGCRIIDSPRERMLAMLTNSFMPCNGRFPALIALIGMFIWPGSEIGSALVMTGVMVLGVLLTFGTTRLLSATVLKGTPSSYTLELPPYRKPDIGRVIVRSLIDRTLFVLGRALAVAAPAGLLLWMMVNVPLGGENLLTVCSRLLDPLGRLMGMDGVILLAFILGIPANEIVLPIAVMIYSSGNTLTALGSLAETEAILAANGWSWATAVSVMLFYLLHWPCSTTLLTIRKESGGWKWALLAAAIPTALGIVFCMAFTALIG